MINPTQPLKRYGLAIAAVLLALLLMLALDPLLRLTQASFLLFFGAVTVSALYSGRGPGMAATLLSALFANYFFLAPQNNWSFDLASSLRLVLFILQGSLISVLVGAFRTAQEQTRKSFNQLKATEAEIKDLNQTLQRRVNELQTLFDVIPISIAIAEDPDCRTIKANAAFSRLLQVPSDANTSCTPLPGQSLPPFRFYQNGRELTGDELPQQYAAKQGVELRDLEIDIVRGDNTVVNLYGSAAPLFDESGKPRGSVSAFVDISERKRMEIALHKLVECSKITGFAFFQTLVRILAELFQVRYAYVGEIVPNNPSQVRTIAAWVDGKPGENIEYDLTNTPCAQVVQQQGTCFYPRNVTSLFPHDQILVEMGIESYMGTPLRASTGEVVGLLTILHDQPLEESFNPQALLEIFAGKTAAELQRERAIAQLRQSEERYRAFVTYSAEGIWRFELEAPLPITLSEDSQIEHLYQYAYLAECNQVMAEMYGFSSIEEIIGARLGDLVPPADPRNLEYLRTFIRAGYRLREAESYESDRFGNAKYFANNLVGIIEDGCLIRAWGNQRDISERRQIEAALRESETRFRQLTDAAPMLVWMSGTDKLCNYFNQTWLTFTGRTMEQEMGNGWTEGVHPDDFQRCLDTYVSAFDARRPFEMDYRLKRFDGEYRWIMDVGVPRLTPDNKFLGYIGSCFDIHDRKQAAAEREQLLAREQAAREAAEQANRVKDEFLAVLSHELRSPLNPILGWTKLLRTGKLDATKTDVALDTIERNAKLQTQLIEDLLDVSRILRGKLSLNMVPVPLIATLESALETVRLAAEAKQIQIDTHYDAALKPVLGDSARLQQIFWNLLSNAIKFTPEGGQVRVLLENAGSHARITVADTGRGISPDFLPYVFDYFRQADSTTTRRFGGLGLGLAIVRHLVELHGGHVTAESLGEEQGTTFTVTLPLMPTSASIPPETVPMSDFLNLQGVQVLAVDDEVDNLELVQFILEEAGATVIAISLATEALEKIPQIKPHLIVADIGMPEVDGYTLLQRVRNLPLEQGGQIPAIALTAYASDENQRQALAAGFQRHLSKPVDPEALVQAIAELLHRT